MGTLLFLGLLQGLTEFLPISSSGHLVLAQVWLGVELPGVLFDALVHLGTVGAVALFYRRRLGALCRRPFSAAARGWWGRLVLATLPIAVAGVLFKSQIEASFHSPLVAAGGLLWTGTVLAWGGRRTGGRGRPETLPVLGALFIGLAQALALLPGVSRSGMTLVAALAVGLERERAAEFSFLLSVPAVLGAVTLQLLGTEDWTAQAALWPGYVGGTIVALVSGLIAIGTLVRVLSRGRLSAFALYCWVLGLGALLWHLR